jgi:guanylate kinase
LNEGLLVVVCGPSGVGKTTLCRKLVEEGLVVSLLTCTTREPRDGDVNGVDYHFLSKEEFEHHLASGDFLEHALVHGNHYGVLREVLEESLKTGKCPILNVDYQGAATLRSLYPKLLDIFVDVSELEILRERLMKRSLDSSEVVERRLVQAAKERKQSHLFKARVYNDNLKECYEEMKELIHHYRKENHVG